MSANRGASYAASGAQQPGGGRPFPWALVDLPHFLFFSTTRVSQLIVFAIVLVINKAASAYFSSRK
jgi:hypothetical protein